MDNKYHTARKLRKEATPQEIKIWNLLRNRNFNGIKFVRQYPIGHYVVDFASRKHRIVIELDGGQHNEPENILKDKIRDDFITSQGYKIIRFWNNEIDNDLEGVYLRLLDFIGKE